MNKVISELSPYHDVSYDNKNLCLDPNPLSRTEAEEIKKFLSQRPKESLMLKNNRYVIASLSLRQIDISKLNIYEYDKSPNI
ncbi:hypothetical protein RhiirA5_432597 [Rhizophagus irregularis]|uniref:Uncharacterized protein n=1 Tax=Rhizophagus irregularis TaxID=588596 RepID=A0A2N0NT25_9GLOM|nr:hypothetical protein RhiirA5_432597 [Rhizophagus irregularis]PKC56137.1 hypothetical protein RhiirA1_474445 [Rhizophagus irregularis]